MAVVPVETLELSDQETTQTRRLRTASVYGRLIPWFHKEIRMSANRYPKLVELFQKHEIDPRRPPQFMGTLTEGEFVYARARETRMEVEIYADEEDFGLNHKRTGYYRQPMEYDAGFVEYDVFVAYIVECVEAYIASLEG